MVKQIELINDQEFSCEYLENDKVMANSLNKTRHVFNVGSLPVKIKIKMDPWKLRPDIRFDGHLVNYGLAEITPWDHMLEFNLPEDYKDRYFKNIIKAKKEYLSRTGRDIPDNMESYVGVNNWYPEIVDKIKEQIK